MEDGMKFTFWRQRKDLKEESPPESSELEQDRVERAHGQRTSSLGFKPQAVSVGTSRGRLGARS
jgi:hypothetical protein